MEDRNGCTVLYLNFWTLENEMVDKIRTAKILKPNSSSSHLVDLDFALYTGWEGAHLAYPALRTTPWDPHLGNIQSSHLTGQVSFWMHQLFTLRQCSGSVTFWYGSGSSNPYFWLMHPDDDPDPDPALFVSDLQDANKKYFFSLLGFYACIPFWRYTYIILSLKEFTKQ
jgi:hypothetical protein